jgi:CheY-like chemotaxis protein
MARILVIDDQASVLDVLRKVLEAAGHRVGTARSGEEGLRLFREQPADLVLCDLFLPGVDGLEVIQELKGGWPHVPVVAISGGSCDGEWDVLPAAEALGADAALRKPFTVGALLGAVGALLGAVEGALRGGA